MNGQLHPGNEPFGMHMNNQFQDRDLLAEEAFLRGADDLLVDFE